MSLTYMDLFCGIGGFHQVLTNQMNHTCVLACDIDQSCRINYKENYDIEPHINVCNITPQDIKGDVDIICGGFPCQPFSNGGKKRTFSDKRGLLFDEIMRLAQLTKPKFMFLENVKHILKVNDGQVIQYIESEINNNGYVLQRFEMSPHLYGIPQQRERIYFARSKC